MDKYSKFKYVLIGVLVGICIIIAGQKFFIHNITEIIKKEMQPVYSFEEPFFMLKSMQSKDYININKTLEKQLELGLLNVSNSDVQKVDNGTRLLLSKVKTFLINNPITYSNEENKQKIWTFLNAL